MAILRTAFVKVTPDTSKFDEELKAKLRGVKADEPGDKVGKSFSSSLTRRIDRELKAFDLPILDLKGNPRDAVKAIDTARVRLEQLRDGAESIELRVRANKALGDLNQFQKTIGDVGPDIGTKLGAEASDGFLSAFTTSLRAAPAASVAGGVLAVAMAPTLAAGVAGAVVGAAGVGGIVGGVKLAARDARVKEAGESLGNFILGDLEDRASGFVPVVLDGIDDIRAGWKTLGPDLDRIFSSSRFVDPLVAGAVSGGRSLIRGVADMVAKSEPVIAAFGSGLDRIGDATGDVLSTLADDADEGASAINDMTVAMSNFIRVSGQILHAGAALKGYADDLDTVVDRSRYWIEDSSWLAKTLGELGVKLDITGDGFAAGSKEAEAYRQATLGSATAADFAALKLAGMTDAQISAIDASGTYRARTDDVNAALGKSAGHYVETTTAAQRLKAQTQLLSDVQGVAAQEMDSLLYRTGAVTAAMDSQRTVADLLRQAHDRMYGSVIAASEANEGYQASWDDLSAAVKENGRSLRIGTEEGRANRDALQDLLGSTNELFYAEVQTGSSIAEATKKHQDRITAVKEEAKRLGLNRTETQKLIDTYGKIPPAKKTDLLVEGIDRIGRTLTDLYIFQRSLATGRTLAQVRSELFGGYAGNPRVFKADGGPIPGSSPSDTADNIPIMATADEYMIRRRSARRLGRPVLDYINQRGELPPVGRYAAGGPIGQLAGRDWGARMRFPVDVSDSHVMSRKDAASKVVAAAPSEGATAPWMVRVLRQAFPGLALISGFRPGSRTLSGNQSYHALNRAVDYPPDRDMARWVFTNYKARTREFISPFQEYNILRGAPHQYTGPVWNQHNFAGGNAHNHWAMANGGVIPEPVFGVGRSGRTYSFGEVGPETVVPGVGPVGATYNITVQVAPTAHPAEVGRQVVESIRAYEQSNGSRWRQS